MQRSTIATFLIVLLWTFGPSGLHTPAFADGLIYKLPRDGTSAEFQGVAEYNSTISVPKEIEEKLTPESKARLISNEKVRLNVTVSSVGEVIRAGQKCRWIELAMRPEPVGEVALAQAEGDESATHVLKMLIPEKFLTRGQDPLQHAVLTFFNPKPCDKEKVEHEKGFDRIQYELDRLRSVFPDPLQGVSKLPGETIRTPAGTFADCQVISGTTEFDRPLLGQGRWEYKNSWQIALHPDAPFGVVRIQCQSEGIEISNECTVKASTNYTLKLVRTGNNAKSALVVKDVDEQSPDK